MQNPILLQYVRTSRSYIFLILIGRNSSRVTYGPLRHSTVLHFSVLEFAKQKTGGIRKSFSTVIVSQQFASQVEAITEDNKFTIMAGVLIGFSDDETSGNALSSEMESDGTNR